MMNKRNKNERGANIYDHVPTVRELTRQLTRRPFSSGSRGALIRQAAAVLAVLLACVALLVVLSFITVQRLRYMSFTIPATVFLIIIVLFSDRLAVFFIRVYQTLAPARVRGRCLFHPTCSEYMILAVEKYGTLHGISKGISRLRRCNVKTGGGRDYL